MAVTASIFTFWYYTAMRVREVELRNFRNYTKRRFEFGQKMLVLGPNGSGKSNLLEAVYMLATGKSFRAEREDEVISYGENVASAKCEVLSAKAEKTDLLVILTDGPTSLKLRGVKKKFEVNGIPKRMVDSAGQLKAVLFGPQDMELVTGSPSGRRRYLDFVISQADREYRRCQISYEKGLRQRNKLLERIREGMANRSQLFFWDKLLIKNGEYITRKREEYLNKLNSLPAMPAGRQVVQFASFYDKSVISEARLEPYEAGEVAAAATLVGPHRDDFGVEMNGRDVSKYGSRGEQRMTVLWLKEGELNYLVADDQMPVLLLDDILSELDHERRDKVLEIVDKLVKRDGQVIMTAADEHLMPGGKDWVKIQL